MDGESTKHHIPKGSNLYRNNYLIFDTQKKKRERERE